MWGLADARRKAAEHWSAVADWRDPPAEKRRTGAPTFRETAQVVYDAASQAAKLCPRSLLSAYKKTMHLGFGLYQKECSVVNCKRDAGQS